MGFLNQFFWLDGTTSELDCKQFVRKLSLMRTAIYEFDFPVTGTESGAPFYVLFICVKRM